MRQVCRNYQKEDEMNKFLFSETASSHMLTISIMRWNGGRTYNARRLWIVKFIQLAGTRHHYLNFG